MNLADIRLDNALKLMLRPMNLVAVPRNEVLLITTENAALDMLEVRTYRIPTEWPMSQEEFEKLLLRVVTRDAWDEMGGPCTVTTIDHGIVVSATHEVHEAINALMGQLRRQYP